MILKNKHIKLFNQILSDGINKRCSDTNRDYYKDWTSEEIYELNYRAIELNDDLQEYISKGYTIKNDFLDDYDVVYVVKHELISNYSYGIAKIMEEEI